MMKKQILTLFIIGTFLAGAAVTFLSVDVLAAGSDKGCGTDTSIISCDNVSGGGVEGSGVWSILLTAINILTAGIGIAAVGGIVYGAVLYTSAGGNQEQVKKAMGIIQNVVIGVLAYAAMFAFLNFLIPGGVFRPSDPAPAEDGEETTLIVRSIG